MALLDDWLSGDTWGVIKTKFSAMLNVVNGIGGGTTGQILKKVSGSDFDVQWADYIPDGGTTGQILAKASDTDLDLEWIDPVDAESAALAVNGGLRRLIVNIGDWNMDSASSVNVAHTISNFKKIMGVCVMIRKDDDTAYYPLNAAGDPSTGGASLQGGIRSIGSTNINISRSDGGFFDSTDFNSTSYNRGFIIIDYID